MIRKLNIRPALAAAALLVACGQAPPQPYFVDLEAVVDLEGRPAEARPAEARPAEARPAEARPAEARPAFVHRPGADGRFYFPEVMGSGGALFDYDGDGDLDLYAVQGGVSVEGAEARTGKVPGGEERPRDRLFRNDLGAAGPRFVDVTDAAGLDAAGYGMGAAVGDVDNDGHADLYVLNVGANQ